MHCYVNNEEEEEDEEEEERQSILNPRDDIFCTIFLLEDLLPIGVEENAVGDNLVSASILFAASFSEKVDNDVGISKSSFFSFSVINSFQLVTSCTADLNLALYCG